MLDLITTRTMNSREIAELTDKEHKNVIRDIRNMLDELTRDGSSLSHLFSEEKDARGYTSCYHLSRELTDCLLTGYSAVARMKVIKRWHELETKATQPAQLSRMDILKLAMESEQARIEAEEKLAIAAPKAQALDLLSQTQGSHCVTDSAKLLKVTRTELFNLLQQERWVYRRPPNPDWIAYDAKRHQGLLEHVSHTFTRRDGSEGYRTSVYVTAKGLAKLALMLQGTEEVAE